MERKPFEKRIADLINARTSYESDWKDISTYIRPTRGFFSETPGNSRSIDHKALINNTPTLAARILSSGLVSGLTSPSRPWFRLGLQNQALKEVASVVAWLSEVQELMMGVFSTSNIYGVLHAIYDEIGSFGTGCAILLDDFQDVIRGRSFTAGEYYLGVGADGRVNTFARVVYFTVGQLVQAFGIENVCQSTKMKYENGQIDEYVKFNHLIEPNDDRLEGKKDFKNMKFRSVYWEDSSPADTFLKVHGFNGFPVLCPRWDLTTSIDVYGKGCGHEALGDSKMLQKMEKMKLVALEKVVNPPLQQDGSVQGEANTLPGGITKTTATGADGGVRPAYEVRPDLGAIQASIQQTKEDITRTFYADLFLMITGIERSGVTAREIVERHEEKLLVLGPVLERLESELLDPLITRTFEIMLELGLIPPPPPELDNQEMKVEYISMLAQAQKLVGMGSVERLVGFAGQSAAVFPNVLDKINIDEVIDEISEMLGVNPKLVNSDERVSQIRTARQEAMEAEHNAQKGMSMIEGAEKLSKTEVNDTNALGKIVEAAKSKGVSVGR